MPGETEKAITSHQGKLEKLEVKKKEEEEKMAVVMEGLKTETKVRLSSELNIINIKIWYRPLHVSKIGHS